MKETYLLNSINLHKSKAFERTGYSDDFSLEIYREIDKLYPSNSSFRNAALAITDNYFSRAIELAILGQFPSSFIEIHSLLEVAAIRFFSMNMKVKSYPDLIGQLLERKTLNEIGPYYFELGVWSRKDITFIKRLSNIRNGIAHRNFDILTKHLDSSKKLIGDDYDKLKFEPSECFKSIAKSIDLCVKLYKRPKRKLEIPNQF